MCGSKKEVQFAEDAKARTCPPTPAPTPQPINNLGCKGYCGRRNQFGKCWCDNLCTNFGDCCSDYNDFCVGNNPKNDRRVRSILSEAERRSMRSGLPARPQ